MSGDGGGMARVQQLQRELPHLQRLIDEQNWKGLQEKATELERDAAQLGIDSAYVSWCLAVAHVELGETSSALEAISHAACLDPAQPAICRTFADVCDRARARLVADEEDSSVITDLYELLSRLGETDAACHLRRARHAFSGGDTAMAVRLVDAVLVLHPTNVAACALRAEIAQRTDDPHAASFETMTAEAQSAEATFGVPCANTPC